MKHKTAFSGKDCPFGRSKEKTYGRITFGGATIVQIKVE